MADCRDFWQTRELAARVTGYRVESSRVPGWLVPQVCNPCDKELAGIPGYPGTRVTVVAGRPHPDTF
eukprot:2525013-Rhodomonas_salina.1